MKTALKKAALPTAKRAKSPKESPRISVPSKSKKAYLSIIHSEIKNYSKGDYPTGHTCLDEAVLNQNLCGAAAVCPDYSDLQVSKIAAITNTEVR